MQFLSNSTIEILKKYKDVEPYEHINGVDICSVEQSDLSFMLGYISASMRIEEKLNKKIECYEKTLFKIRELYESDDENKLDEFLYGLFTNEVYNDSY